MFPQSLYFRWPMNESRRKYLLHAIAEYSDQSAFDELFTFYFPALVPFANNIVKDVQLAEEVVEDVFVKLWHNRKTMVSIRSFSHYIYTATKYTAISSLKNQRTILYEDFSEDLRLTYSSPETIFISNENIAGIAMAINELPPKCRLVFRLIKEEGLKYEEVAQLLQISVKTVERQMSIATKKLITALQRMLPELRDHLKQKKA